MPAASGRLFRAVPCKVDTKPGHPAPIAGFAAFSPHLHIAEEFVATKEIQPTLFVLDESSQGHTISAISAFPDEGEVLFGPAVKFEVVQNSALKEEVEELLAWNWKEGLNGVQEPSMPPKVVCIKEVQDKA